jgi:carotenoid cleavage dioxygenase
MIASRRRGVTTNRYLEGNFGPVHEELTVTDLPVTGTLPSELSGRYLRIGPNPVTAPDPATYHWFTGDGMVHGVRLRDGRAEWYRNQWVRSASVSATLEEAPKGGPVFGDMDFANNTNAVGFAGSTWALVEAGATPVEMTYELETVGRSDFGGTLPGGFTAHPKIDPDTGEMHAMAYWWGWGDKVQYVVIGTDGRVRRTVDVTVGGPTMMHDFAITERNVVIFDLPVTFDLDAAMTGENFPYRWDPSYTPRIGLLPRDGAADDVRWAEVEPCYVFHPMNAHDLPDGRVVVDVARHPKMFATDTNGPNEGSPTLDRWTIDTASGKVLEERLDDRGQEFPRVDERLVGKRNRYGYCAGFDTGVRHGPLLKHDLQAGTVESHDYGPGRVTGEGVFVPRDAGAAEDDGYVLSFVYDEARDGSDLVLLSAQDFAGEPLAVVHLPQRVPFGFHGNWVADR